MDLIDLIQYRRQISIGLVVVMLVGWYAYGYRPRSARIAELAKSAETLSAERTRVLQQIERERSAPTRTHALPSRIAPAAATTLSPLDRLNYFLDHITKPANELELSYFSVTPLPPASGPGYEEIPFTISVAGSFEALTDYMYDLEYAQDFVVRDLGVTAREKSLQADFRLSALLLTDPAAKPAAKTARDPGRPSSLELARDPFTRPPAKVAMGTDGKPYFLNVPAGLHLSGVMQTGGRKAAIINHEPYGVGSTIENKTITKITDRGVELSDKARAYFLEMEQPPYSTTTASAAKEARAR
jgi:Tfp pilus assembly protein PilO